MASEEEFIEVLEKNRVDIVQRLQLDRTFLFDYLRSKSIFDRTDCELVLTERTRDLKAGKFLDILISKGEEGFHHFVDALQLLNPGLYEQITGEKASAKPNPIMTKMRTSFIGDGRMPDVDIMSSQLQRTISDMNDLTLRYQEVLKERQDLGKKLDQAESDLEVKHKRVEELERQKSETTNEFLQAYTFANTAKESVVLQLQSLHRDLQERNTYIIALQMKLLSSQERIDNLKNQLVETEVKTEKLDTKLHEVTKNYDNQRRESIKLSERLETHKSDIQKHEEIKKRLREVQFNAQKFKAERDGLMKELNDLKDWCEVLNSRYDIVEDERRQIQESLESKAAENANLRYRIDELELRLSIANREVEEHKRTNADLNESAKKFKEQRDSFAQYRKEAIIERDVARVERDEAVRKYNELLQSRDETITKHAEHSKHFEEQSEKAGVELRELKERLAKTELEYQELRRMKMEEEVYEERSPPQQLKTLTVPANPSGFPSLSSESGTPSVTHSDDSFDWTQRRKTTTIIDSMKKRFGKGPALSRQDPVMSCMSDPEDINNLDKRLEELVPEMRQLSTEAKQSLSLERHKNVFKTTPKFAQLAYMFEASLSSTSVTVGDLSAGDRPSFGKQMSDNSTGGFDWKMEALNSTASSDSGMFGCVQLGVPNASFESETFESENNGSSPNEKQEKPDKPLKPPYLKSLSSPSSTFYATHGQSINAEKEDNSSMAQIHGKLSFQGDEEASSILQWGDVEKSKREVERALQSPSIRKEPFRNRLQAFHFKDSERTRSSSLPPDPESDVTTEEQALQAAKKRCRKISAPSPTNNVAPTSEITTKPSPIKNVAPTPEITTKPDTETPPSPQEQHESAL